MTDGAADASGSRLERALALWLEFEEAGARDPERLLAAHPDLHEELQAMLGADDDDAAPDGEVLGDFRLVRELGRGGMGIVHEAWQRSLDRRVALKLLSPALSADPAAVARFRREAAAVARLRHPGIVEVYGLHGDGQRHWFAMGLIDGEPLWRCAARFRDPAAAVVLVCQVAEALQHAHAHGIVHRDVKPGNVLVRADGAAVLTDFGLAHDAELPGVTTEGSFLGTIDYASPEQLQGLPVDARTDLWSLGIVLWELLAGRRPFAREGAAATMKAILTDEPPPLRRACAAVTPDLVAIVGRALQKDPARRYPSAAALLADLRAWQSGGVVSVRAPGVVERLLRWTRREPWRATAVAVVLTALPVTAGLVVYLGANARRIEAARLAEDDTRREELLATVWQRSMDGDAAGMLAALEAMPAGGDEREAAIWRALALHDERRTGAALAALGSWRDPVADFVRGHLDGDAPDALAVPTAALTAFDCFLLAASVARESRAGPLAGTRARRAYELATLAVTLSPRPRLSHLLVWADTALRTRDAAAMSAAANALLRHFPDDRLALDEGAMLLQDIDPERSLELLARAWTGREDARYHNNRGARLLQLRRFQEAEAALRIATAQRPDYGLAWLNLGTALRRLDRFEESEAALRRAVELLPAARAWSGLGLTLGRLQRWTEARAAYQRAIEIEPGYATALYNMGDVERTLGDPGAAVDLFRRAIAADPQYLTAVRALAALLRREGRTEEALVEYLRAAALAPRDGGIQTGLAEVALGVGLATVARRAAEHSVQLDDSVARRILVARALALGGDVDGALAALDAAEREPALVRDPDRGGLDEWRERLRVK
ncbi:MAG: protein kinase [Planctomycetota bacterium]